MSNEKRQHLLILIDVAIALCASGLMVIFARMIERLFVD
jgi:hypothetical protein